MVTRSSRRATRILGGRCSGLLTIARVAAVAVCGFGILAGVGSTLVFTRWVRGSSPEFAFAWLASVLCVFASIIVGGTAFSLGLGRARPLSSTFSHLAKVSAAVAAVIAVVSLLIEFLSPIRILFD